MQKLDVFLRGENRQPFRVPGGSCGSCRWPRPAGSQRRKRDSASAFSIVRRGRSCSRQREKPFTSLPRRWLRRTRPHAERHRQLTGLWSQRGLMGSLSDREGCAGHLSPGQESLDPIAAMVRIGEVGGAAKRLATWSWTDRNRCAWPGDLKRFMIRSRRRVG